MLKLERMLGHARALEVIDEILRTLGLTTLSNADDRLRFGAALICKGGALAVVGRSIRVQAILHGATDD